MIEVSNDDDFGYDTDTVSLASTTGSEGQEIYDVEDIIAEETDDDGIVRYLVKWQGYSMHECTLEPYEHIEDSSLPHIWAERKRNKGRHFDSYCRQNLVDWRNAQEKEEQRKAIKAEKREKRRRKEAAIAAEASHHGYREENDDEVPLTHQIQVARLQRQNREQTEEISPLFCTGPPKTRRLPLIQSSSSERSDDESVGLHTSFVKEANSISKPKPVKENSNQTTPVEKAQHLSENKPTSPTDIQSTRRPISKRQLHDGSLHSAAECSPLIKNRNLIPNPPAAEPRTMSHSVRASRTTGSKATPLASIRRSAPASHIRLVNQPKSQPKKPSQSGTSGAGGDHYTHLATRWKAQLRGRNEQTPDIMELQFPNGAPSVTSLQAALQERNRDPQDDLYGRRKKGHRRVQEEDEKKGEANEDEGEGEDRNDTPKDLADIDKRKIPRTCWEWHNNSCVYGDKCRFQHREGWKMSPLDGSVPAGYRDPPITCNPWMTRGCNNTDDDCDFAHWNTGLMGVPGGVPLRIDPNRQPFHQHHQQPHRHVQQENQRPIFENTSVSAPSKLPPHMLECYFWKNGDNCRLSADECKYAHKITSKTARGPSVVAKKHKPRKGSNPGNYTSINPTKPHAAFPHGENTALGSDARHEHMVTDLDEMLGSMAQQDASEMSTSLPSTRQTQLSDPIMSTDQMLKMLEESCGLDFLRMFSYNLETREGNSLMDRRAFLVFHPVDHAEELDIITRWLLLHHVEVFGFWDDGAWNHFKTQTLRGSTGVILAHPEFFHWWQVPEFGKVLRSNIRVFSVGFQYANEMDLEASTQFTKPKYACIEIFPHGGLIYITDDVFDRKPVEAAKIMELYCSKVHKCHELGGFADPWKYISDGPLLWRLATRPELMESIMNWLQEHEEDLHANRPEPQALANMYEMLTHYGYVEQDDGGPYVARPTDYFPIISEKRQMCPQYYEQLARGQKEANKEQVKLFGERLVYLNRDYRHFIVVHTEPSDVDWQQKYQQLDEIMTPEQLIQCLEEPDAPGMRIDFGHWMFQE
ncbi:hypothetical protein B0J11DRAFT_542776 [Dendryphion nanum]|uniref:Chromo domain-containing protein n=1 Tax=Dendryphion nanum TaxID=256645 RepID=A0A9P9I8Q1_9PLEO|nr:hypothetical protein B0J11DRAFT_542776 [Dendryphion nanum]